MAARTNAPTTTAEEKLRSDPFYKKFGLVRLNAEGFIDCKPKTTLENVRPSAKTTEEMKRVGEPFDFQIHPVFHFDRFSGVSQTDYDTFLTPVVRLATCLLSDLCVLPFFNSLLNREPDLIHNDEAEKAFGQQLYSFGNDETPMTDNELKRTWIKLQLLADYITWRQGKDDEGPAHRPYMYTQRMRKIPGYVPGRTHGSEIYFMPQYLAILRGDVNPQTLAGTEGFDQEDSKLRTAVLMANTMCHELCHAAAICYHEQHEEAFDKDANERFLWTPLPAEPFYRDDNTCELGWAYNQAITGGIFAPMGYQVPGDVRAFMGLYQSDFASRIKAPNPTHRYMLRDPRSDLGLTTQVRRAVLMRYMQDLYSQEFWDKRVATQGLLALRPPVTEFCVSLTLRTGAAVPAQAPSTAPAPASAPAPSGPAPGP